jgi:ribosome biogenesis GTPase A
MRIRYSFSSRKTGTIEGGNAHRKPFPSIVRDLVKLSDIILEVIDARFPDKTRNMELEALIAARGKKLVYVFNKIDIADKDVVEQYIQEKQTFPYVLTSCSKRAGSRALRERICYCCGEFGKKLITVKIC